MLLLNLQEVFWTFLNLLTLDTPWFLRTNLLKCLLMCITIRTLKIAIWSIFLVFVIISCCYLFHLLKVLSLQSCLYRFAFFLRLLRPQAVSCVVILYLTLLHFIQFLFQMGSFSAFVLCISGWENDCFIFRWYELGMESLFWRWWGR